MKKLTITFIILDILVAIYFFVVYSPFFEELQNTIISTAVNTKTHDYIAYIFYSEEHVNKMVAMSFRIFTIKVLVFIPSNLLSISRFGRHSTIEYS